jgi:arylsulfatase A-like enzyme
MADRPVIRRTVLTSGAGAALAFAMRPSVARAVGSRPNILVAVADDWGHPHASVYGYPGVRTPAFDRVAAEGAVFRRAFCAAPTCTASRGAILTGQAPHRLGEGANLQSFLPTALDVYPDLLEAAGYRVGKTRKGWGPGVLGERTRNPAGPNFLSFEDFLGGQPAEAPFCFWLGSSDPHRPYAGGGETSGIDPQSISVPPYLPDTPEVRADIVEYLAEVQRFDMGVAHALALLDHRGLADNTLVVVTGDNGWPFPRGKANLYDSGSRVPLAMRWPARVPAGQDVSRLTTLTDLAPTFMAAAGLSVPSSMTGQSLLPTLTGTTAGRSFVVVERERHANARTGNLGYPVRALRTRRWLYIRNFFPERWPAGDPDYSGSQGFFSDIDASPTKAQLVDNRDHAEFADAFHRATDRRGAEELYDVLADPHCLRDLSASRQHAQTKANLATKLQRWMRRTADQRASEPQTTFWDDVPYLPRA